MPRRAALRAATTLLMTLLYHHFHASLALDADDQGPGTSRRLGGSSNDSDSGSNSSSDSTGAMKIQQNGDDSGSSSASNNTTYAAEGFSSTAIVVLALGVATIAGLALVIITLRREQCAETDSNDQPPSSSHSSRDLQSGSARNYPKRKTFAVTGSTDGSDDDSIHSNIAVLEGIPSASHMDEDARPASERSWGEASATTSAYSFAPLSSRHARPAKPVRIYAPALADSRIESELSSNTDDYSIDILESPGSTEYSLDLNLERDDIFPTMSPRMFWDGVDSDHRFNCTWLSTTSSSSVFDLDRSGGEWTQAYHPTEPPAVGSTLQPVDQGILFVRRTESPRNTNLMRVDPRRNDTKPGSSSMHFGVEV